MRKKGTEVRVGIAVVLAAIILITGIIWIGEFRLSRKWDRYIVYFNDVGGLEAGDPVTVSGVEKGEVGSVSLDGGRVRTELLIEEDIKLHKDCNIEIRSIGLMGEKFVAVSPGSSGKVLAPGSVIEGRYTPGLGEVVADVGEMLEGARKTMDTLKDLLSTGTGKGTLAQSIGRLDKAAQELLALLRENRNDIRETARNMKRITGEVGDLVADGRQDMLVAVNRFASAATRLDSLTRKLDTIVANLEKGEGTLGMLINRPDIHQDLERTLNSINDLITDIKEHPERYFRVEIF